MNEVDGNREMRAEAVPFESAERPPDPTESREQGGEFYHGAAADDRPHVEPELGEAAVHGYSEVPGEFAESQAEADTEGEVYDIWDRRNETSGSINLRNFGR
jgi:hypothetical protein